MRNYKHLGTKTNFQLATFFELRQTLRNKKKLSLQFFLDIS